jgi:hypothetical protein
MNQLDCPFKYRKFAMIRHTTMIPKTHTSLTTCSRPLKSKCKPSVIASRIVLSQICRSHEFPAIASYLFSCYFFGLSPRVVGLMTSPNSRGVDTGCLLNRTTITDTLSVEKFSRAYLTRISAASSGECILRIKLTAT